MSYYLEITEKVKLDLKLHAKAGDTKLVEKVYTLFAELEQHPFSGTGHPEQLRYHNEIKWSRHINKKHRLIYEIQEDKLIVIAISAHGHYDDK